MEATKGYISNKDAIDNYSVGWQLLKANFVSLLLVLILSSVVNAPGNILPEILGFGWQIFIGLPVGVGVSWVFLKAARAQKFEITDMFEVFKTNYVNAILASLATGFLVLIGLIFLIIPGIYIAIKLSFVTYLVMDKNMDATTAIKTSWNMTKGHELTIFLMLLIAIPVIILGILALFVGIFVSVVLITAATTVLYNSVAAEFDFSSVNAGSPTPTAVTDTTAEPVAAEASSGPVTKN